MKPATGFLRHALSVILALTPLLASADLCTVGALTGRADMACAMEGAASACCAAPAVDAACSQCAPATPVRETPRPRGPTCCDLQPQAEGATAQPVLVLPLPVVHAAASVVVAPVVVSSPFGVASDDGRAPPADLPPQLSPRAPPLG